MVAILVLAVAPFLAALISELAHRSIVSPAVLFLIVGSLCGTGVYGIHVVQSGIPHSGTFFALIALVVMLSIVAHSSTDGIVAHWFERDRAGVAVRGGAGRRPG